MPAQCDVCKKTFPCPSALRRHRAGKRPCVAVTGSAAAAEPAAAPAGPDCALAVWAPHSVVRLDCKRIQDVYAGAALSAYCARSPAERVLERTSLAPVAHAVVGLLKASRQDTSLRNLRTTAAATLEAFGAGGWAPIGAEDAAAALVDGAVAELWWHLLRAPQALTLSVRCAASTTVLSVRHASAEWRAHLLGLVQGRLHAALASRARAPASDKEPIELPPRQSGGPAVRPPPVPAQRARPAALTLSAARVAELYTAAARSADSRQVAEALAAAAAAAVGSVLDKNIRERVEQKLWEASADGLLESRQIDEVRRCLLEPV